MFSRWTPPAFRFCFYCFCLWSFQVGINSHPAPCDGRSVLLQLSCPGALLFDQGVGVKEGAGHHKLRGSVSSGGRRAGTKMSAGWHHQDGVQGNSLDVPLWSCEYIQLMLENYCMLFFFFSFSFSFLSFIFHIWFLELYRKTMLQHLSYQEVPVFFSCLVEQHYFTVMLQKCFVQNFTRLSKQHECE